jgi:putative phosphoesterase
MRIGIISDTHSSFQTVEKALHLLGEHGIDFVLHCGDIDDADTVRMFRGLTAHFVFGNCDCDRAELRRAMKEIGATLHEHYGDLELEGRKIAWIHGDNRQLLQDVERSGHYDYLFYGHSHQAERHYTGPTLVINPGALYRARTKTFVVLDLACGEIESVVVE